MLKGQHVQDSTGRDLILLDPTDQPYQVLMADPKTMQVLKFEKDPVSPL